MIEIKTNINIDTEIVGLKESVSQLEIIDDEQDLTKYQKNRINKLLTNPTLNTVCGNIYNQKYLKGLSYEQLTGILETLISFAKNLKSEKDKIDIKIFFDEKKVIDLPKLKKKFKLLGCDKRFPKFDFQKFRAFLEHPPTEILPRDGSNKTPIKYDKLVVTKYLYAILQMVVNEMDLFVIFTGGEGMGKSKECSQHMNLLHYLLTELGLITYEYKIEDMWFNTVQGFNEAEDKYFEERFRILGLDEGNELNSQDWQDEVVKTFFQRLRRERERQRIKLISIPQLVELLKGLVVSRANFIFESESRDEFKTGTLDKGYTNFYIIPKNKIYSYASKKILTKGDVLTKLINSLKDKNTGYRGLPKEILIKKYKSNFIWGFDKEKYKETLKDTNKTYSVSKGLKLTEGVAFYMYKFMPKMKDWGFNAYNKKLHSKAYASLQKTRKQIMNIFDNDPNKKLKWEKIYEDMITKKQEEMNANE